VSEGDGHHEEQTQPAVVMALTARRQEMAARQEMVAQSTHKVTSVQPLHMVTGAAWTAAV
jgi:hypothetical protein